MSHLIMTVSSSVRTGIVARIADYLARQGCNILDSSQFSDVVNDRFFMRLMFSVQSEQTAESLSQAFAPIADETGMEFAFHDPARKSKAISLRKRRSPSIAVKTTFVHSFAIRLVAPLDRTDN